MVASTSVKNIIGASLACRQVVMVLRSREDLEERHMDVSDMQQIRIHFDSSNSQSALEWVRLGREIVEETVDEMQHGGMTISIKLVPSIPQSGERGMGIGDFLVNIAANAISSLLINIVVKIFQRIHRPRGVVLDDGKHQLQLNPNESDHALQEEIATWVSDNLPSNAQVDIRPLDE
jgi:hypothetical protein